ncbi:ribosomal protein S18 acetylase RimI-like enzyme [Kibdelosporangium banguiense]|uniref:Ribosomal protein S18 acetylase RimI-like enzyme n=1 Tax=Kibdelosporangium banguiense TaxID=1365924 RepID=A0ABS4TID5_9PSEU|nr:GNAT family N-acetyltransferase [Kibdelosporangium banguiense]MBP2324111.1 ribosomal protein S18 acetylase RimI-like enzyme [Kibdelosporangium banguiense]
MTVREAGYADLPSVGRLLGAAFQDDPVSEWVFPEAERRQAVQPAFFEAFATAALDTGGVVYVRADAIAATVWFPGGEDDGDEDDFMARFGMLTDEEAATFGRLAGLMAEHHPEHGAHMHLQFIGVLPARQRSGIGGELLEHNLAVLDKDSTPAYLEASSQLSPPLYERLGFEHIGVPFGPAGGPRMYPMWRQLV